MRRVLIIALFLICLGCSNSITGSDIDQWEMEAKEPEQQTEIHISGKKQEIKYKPHISGV